MPIHQDLNLITISIYFYFMDFITTLKVNFIYFLFIEYFVEFK